MKKKKDNVYCVVLSGGAGSRLWPRSRKSYPKQFLSLDGSGESLIEKTLKRVSKISPTENRWIVTCEEQVALCKESTEGLVGRIIVEPAPKNTSPAIMLAAHALYKENPDAVMIVLPSDHAISNTKSFEKSLNYAVEYAEKGYFVTLGIYPTHPATGFGYIEIENPVSSRHETADPTENDCFYVKSFQEKPSKSMAEQFILTKKYFWNAGIFVLKVKNFLSEMRKINADQMKIIDKITDENLKKEYESLKAEPIDISFAEKTDNLVCIPARFDWSDVGTWSSVFSTNKSLDSDGNAKEGKILCIDTKNTLITSTSKDYLVATIGLEDMIVIATEDSLLIAPLSRAQDVKKVVEELEKSKQTKYL